MTISIVIPWDYTQLEAPTEWNIWRQLRGAYGLNGFHVSPPMSMMNNVNVVTQYDTVAESLAGAGAGQKVFLRLGGTDSINTIPASDDYVLIAGSTGENLAGLPEAGDWDIELDAVNATDLYGHSAMSILIHRMFKRGLFT